MVEVLLLLQEFSAFSAHGSWSSCFEEGRGKPDEERRRQSKVIEQEEKTPGEGGGHRGVRSRVHLRMGHASVYLFGLCQCADGIFWLTSSGLGLKCPLQVIVTKVLWLMV